MVDLGYVAKVRPCLVLSSSITDRDRALVTLVAHTSSARGTSFEVASNASFLKAGVFDAQNLVTVPLAKLVRPLGLLADADPRLVGLSVIAWLGLANLISEK